MAAPFVQGRLHGTPLSITIHTACAHCDQPLHISVDSELRCQVAEAEAAPLIFEPRLHWDTFTEPNIIQAY
jgi:hypothetical protein